MSTTRELNLKLEQLGDQLAYKEIVSLLSESVLKKHNSSRIYSWLAFAYLHLDELQKTIDATTTAIELDKKEWPALVNRGVAHFRMGMYEKAIHDYSLALKIEKNATILQNWAECLIELGKYEEAIVKFKEVLVIDPSRTNLVDRIGLAEEKINEQKILEETKAQQRDKDEKVRLEKKIDATIAQIRSLARSQVETVVHYTKIFVGDIYVKATGAKMHYSNAIYMNDPMEGKLLFDYLADERIKQAYYRGERRTETSVYLGSFLPANDNDGEISHEDELVMWRTYGKDEEGKEAGGCSIVLSSDFFSTSVKKETLVATELSNEELLNVVYVKNLKNSKVITNDVDNKISGNLKIIKGHLTKLIKIRDSYKEKDDFYKEIENGIFRLLSTIAFLFKSSDYEFEHEVRVIRYTPRDSNLIRSYPNSDPKLPSKRFYVESQNDILPFIKRIYLGPKVAHDQQWSLYFDYEIRQRAKELKTMPSAPYRINPSEIEIMKSSCQFQ